MLLQCVVYSISLDKIINPNAMIETDNLPIQGQNPDYKVYGYYTEFPEPNYDSRGFTLVVNRTRIESPHPTYPDLLTYSVTYSLVRKTDDLLKEAVSNEEHIANEQIQPAIMSCVLRQRAIRVINKKADGLTLDAAEEALLLSQNTISGLMEDNAVNKEQKYAYIDANPTLIPDFDSGWTTSIP